MSFKVGDLVKFISVNNFRLYGEVGMIKHIYFSGECAVCFNRDFDFYSCKESELELVDCSKELVEPAKEGFYSVGDLVLTDTQEVKQIVDINVEFEKTLYKLNEFSNNWTTKYTIQGKLVPFPEKYTGIYVGDEVYRLDTHKKYTIFRVIIKQGYSCYYYMLESGLEAYFTNPECFARLVKPLEDSVYCSPEMIRRLKLLRQLETNNKWNQEYTAMPRNKEESKMDIKEVSKDNIKEAMKIAEQEKKTEAIEFAKGEYYTYLNTLDGYEAQIRIARENIILTEKAIKELKSKYPEFSKKKVK
jgi:hypothetical protein